ncbi:hypothetical protein MTsN3n11_24720 [Qipengyuania sp. MTN3-11]
MSRDSNRTAHSRCFNGGYVGHGPIRSMDYRLPVEKPRGLLARILGRIAA